MGTQEPPEPGAAPAESGAAETNGRRLTSHQPDGGAPESPAGDRKPGVLYRGGAAVPTEAAADPSAEGERSDVVEASAEGERSHVVEASSADEVSDDAGGEHASQDQPGELQAVEGELLVKERGEGERARQSPPQEQIRHSRNLPPDEPAARFEAPEKPSRYATGIGQRQPTRPLDPIRPYMAPPVTRRRRSDWTVMIFAMVIAGLVMVGCCVAGFALYSGYHPFSK